MKILKFLIPTGDKKEIQEIESFTVSWQVREGWANNTLNYNKVFIDKNEAIEFVSNLKEAAKFIGAWISVELNRN